MKPCPGCGQGKSIEDFHRDRSRKDGRSTRCKDYNCKKAREWSRSNPGRSPICTYDPERYRRQKEKAPEKLRARTAINNAVRRGKMTKPDACEDCGENTPSRRLHAHHDDHTKPLEVKWVCVGCHGKQHRVYA